MFGQIIIAFLLSPFLVNALGDEKYGIWSIAAAFTGYMSLLDFGLNSAVGRYISKYNGLNDQNKINKIISTALVLFCVMGLIIFLLSPIMASLIVNYLQFDESLVDIVYLLIIVVSFDVGIFVIGGLFRGTLSGFQRYEIINYTQLLSAVYKAVLFFILVSNGFDLVAMGYASLSANILSALAFYIILSKTYPLVRIRVSDIETRSAKKLIGFSKYVFIAMIANQIIYYSDAFVIGYFMTTAAVTYYSIPWSLSEYTKKMCMAISRTYTPVISESEALGNYDRVRSLYISGTRYMIIVSNLLTVGVIVLGGALIALWMGPKYKELCEGVLIVLLINQFFQGPQHISYSVLQGISKQKIYSYLSFVVSILNLILSISLVQKWGIIGVALGATIPQILFHGIFVPVFTLKTIQLPVWEYFRQTYLKSIIPTGILGISLLYISIYHFPKTYFELITSAIFCAFIYMIFVYGLMLNASEKNVCISFIKKIAHRTIG